MMGEVVDLSKEHQLFKQWWKSKELTTTSESDVRQKPEYHQR
jgi:hypothetical protein